MHRYDLSYRYIGTWATRRLSQLPCLGPARSVPSGATLGQCISGRRASEGSPPAATAVAWSTAWLATRWFGRSSGGAWAVPTSATPTRSSSAQHGTSVSRSTRRARSANRPRSSMSRTCSDHACLLRAGARQRRPSSTGCSGGQTRWSAMSSRSVPTVRGTTWSACTPRAGAGGGSRRSAPVQPARERLPVIVGWAGSSAEGGKESGRAARLPLSGRRRLLSGRRRRRAAEGRTAGRDTADAAGARPLWRWPDTRGTSHARSPSAPAATG